MATLSQGQIERSYISRSKSCEKVSKPYLSFKIAQTNKRLLYRQSKCIMRDKISR